jgi:hypothetical protein
MADRLMYAAAQFFSLTFVYRRVATWARLPAMEADRAGRLLRRDARVLGVAVAVLTVAGVLGCAVALASGLLPADWTQGFWWGALVMLVGAGPRVQRRGHAAARGEPQAALHAVDRHRHVVLNAALDAAFYLWFGPIGIVVSTVVVRWVMAGVYLALLRVVMPRTIGQDVAEQAGGGRHRL